MSSIRQRAVDAAIALVGREGVRALTHGRVDAAAALPPGSTSNHFRTRAALLAGVIERIAETERADGEPQPITTRDELIAMLVHLIESESGPQAARTRARYALFLEADADTAAPLRHQRLAFVDWVRTILDGVGGATAAEHAPFLMAAAEGLLLHRLTIDDTVPLHASIARAVDAALSD